MKKLTGPQLKYLGLLAKHDTWVPVTTANRLKRLGLIVGVHKGVLLHHRLKQYSITDEGRQALEEQQNG